MVFFWYKSVDVALCFIRVEKKTTTTSAAAMWLLLYCDCLFLFSLRFIIRFGINFAIYSIQWTFLRLEWLFFLACIIKNWTKQKISLEKTKNSAIVTETDYDIQPAELHWISQYEQKKPKQRICMCVRWNIEPITY